MLKKSISVVLLCGILLLTACGKKTDTTTEALESSQESVSEVSDIVTSEVDASSTGTPTPNESETQSTPPAASGTDKNSTPQNSGTQENSSKPATANPSADDTPPPATSTPSQPPSQPPATSASAPTTPSEPPTPTKPVYTETDYQAIINEIRQYGENKGFVWVDSFTFEEGHQYYGRPNLERDGYNGVIDMLKYHCDKIDTQYGDCYFKVVKHIYAGNTEFVVLYD